MGQREQQPRKNAELLNAEIFFIGLYPKRDKVKINQPVHFLFISDSPADFSVIKSVCQTLNATLTHASSAEEALKKVLTVDFAGIVLDFQMQAAARFIQSQPGAEAIPFLVLTTSGDLASSLDKSSEVEWVDFLVKPLHSVLLKVRLTFFMELQRCRKEVETLKQLQAVKSELFSSMASCGTPLSESSALSLIHDIHTQRDFINATDRGLAGEALRAAEQRVRLATDAAQLGLWVWQVDEDVVQWENDRIYEIFGLLRSDETINAARFLEEFVHPDDAAAFVKASTATLETGARFHFEGRFFRHSDGDLRWTEFTGLLQNAQGKVPAHLLGTAADITVRKRAEEKLQRLATALSQADRRKSDFLATLAHELRNPLAPLRNGLQVMRLAAKNPVVLEEIRQMMDRQVSYMVHLVDDLLDIARISSGKVDLKKELVALKTIVARAVETSQSLVDASHHKLNICIPEETLLLDVDSTRLTQVLSNLLNNAAKYTPAGGFIELIARQDGSEVVISITDTGVGIPVQALPTLFEMFTQVGQNIDRAQGGLGIGLNLVRRLVELHGGTVSARSSGIGKGSTFTVRLLLAESDGVEMAAISHDAGILINSSKSLRVLVVDDNKDAAESLAMVLRFDGYDARVATDGLKALQIASDFRPEVAFLDIGMPNLNGYALARALRNMKGMEHIFLVALTGWGTDKDRTQSREAGFNHHLAKPAELEAVEALLSQHALSR